MSQKQLKLGAFMRPVSLHAAYQGATPQENLGLSHMASLRRSCHPGQAKRRSGTAGSAEFMPWSRIFALRARPG